ncbi:hypothetical protein [Streptomyces nigrescens]|uniref:hypothetical protein n=1 Tax=Streptomyces nigrescens TaxID=1920 RepID=UPI0036FC444B
MESPASTQDVIEKALADSIASWWQTPPRLDLAAQAVVRALTERDAVLRAKEASR